MTPATFLVTNLNDAGLGSLRQALLDANGAPGSDLVHFQVAGEIRLTTGALPAVTDQVSLDGATAPSSAGAPVVEVNANGFAGFRFNAGSGGSALKSLALVNAAGDGVTLAAGGVTVIGNYIGLRLNGRTAAGNGGDGIAITAASAGNQIGSPTAGQGNVIAANAGNGIAIDGSFGNVIRANFIGTDVTGTRDRGNGGNGILLENGASGNILGGTTPANPPNTNPPDFSGARPSEGNLISGNAGNGVLLDGASHNFLFGNFIGTAASGVKALGNALDGVAIVNGSHGNTLAGTFFVLDPFVFYNVISGNRGNGLRVSDSNDTTIHANFFGLGSDDKTPVGNGLNGVVIEGSSAGTMFGGRVPLGNVVAANALNGVVVKDTATGFVAFNTFCGVGAFVAYPNLGNGGNGFLITSTGGNNLLYFNLSSSNGGNGIEIGGQASGLQVVKNGIGVVLGGGNAANRGHGIEISGNANNNVIGGPQPPITIFPTLGTRDVITANFGYGVAVTGTAHDNQINGSGIGPVALAAQANGNRLGGVYLGPGTSGTVIGSSDPDPFLLTTIGGNRGPGIVMNGTQDNIVIGTRIGIDVQGRPLPNHGDGIQIVNSSGNQIGGIALGEGNVIAHNHRNGVWVKSGQGNAIRRNSIFENVQRGIRLSPGANGNQAAPVLAAAVPVLGGMHVSGTLTSTPNTTFTIELFADTRTHPSAFVQGRFFLGSVTVTTDANGLASFSHHVLDLPPGARALTATATDPLGNTSEFSDPLLLPG